VEELPLAGDWADILVVNGLVACVRHDRVETAMGYQMFDMSNIDGGMVVRVHEYLCKKYTNNLLQLFA
jgi:hypothetical protein